MKTIGLIINPIAGMGGKVGLKGTDSPEILQEARNRGAQPIAGQRTISFLKKLIKYPEHKKLYFIIPQGDMGEKIIGNSNTVSSTLFWQVITEIPIPKETNQKNTYVVAEYLKSIKVDLLIFVGGDGTARDIFQAVGSEFPVLGIPSGVKMHSGVFCHGINKGVQILRQFVQNNIQFVQSEIIDLDEEEFRQDRIITRLYGVCLIPQIPSLMQLSKLTSYFQDSEKDNLEGIIRSYKESIKPDILYILGSGSTIKELARAFSSEIYDQKTLLGIDAVQNLNLIGKDLGESEILFLLENRKNESIRIVVTIIGGQGFIFGRGNQQLSADVIRQVGLGHIDFVATRSKIKNLPNRRLYVDTGDLELNNQFPRYAKVLVDYNQYLMVKIESV
ncbi:MAG: ATP-NAD kinase family protein [Candidatus Hodarchaeota archaeon]